MELGFMGIEVYNQQNAISDDPYILVLKLYEGVIKYLSFVKCYGRWWSWDKIYLYK